ncbi:hypothetical protein PFUM301597_58190 [Pseudomonas fluorescens]
MKCVSICILVIGSVGTALKETDVFYSWAIGDVAPKGYFEPKVVLSEWLLLVDCSVQLSNFVDPAVTPVWLVTPYSRKS